MPKVKLYQYVEDQAMFAQNFFALGVPITLFISFVAPGIGNAGKNHLQALSTTVARGYVYGPPNGLLLGIFGILTIVNFWYYKFSLLRMTDDLRPWKYLYILGNVALILLFIIPPARVQNGSYSYVLHHIMAQVWFLSTLGWHAWLAKFVVHPAGRHLSYLCITIALFFLLISWVVGAASSEAASAPFEWAFFAVLLAYYSVYVFVYENERYTLLNAPGFTSAIPMEPDQPYAGADTHKGTTELSYDQVDG